jgi:peptidoglycan/LPS O-acetylase OafA/YrhL
MPKGLILHKVSSKQGLETTLNSSVTSPHPSNPKLRLSTIDSLRGLACLAVALCHLTLDSKRFTGSALLGSIGGYGMYGVQLFFVISGFVIPLSLAQADYRAGNYLRFLGKRIIRLHPPYLATIGLILCLGYLANFVPQFHGERFAPDLKHILMHLIYGNHAAGYPWLTSVFWTLAIELQWYLLIGLAFPLFWPAPPHPLSLRRNRILPPRRHPSSR